MMDPKVPQSARQRMLASAAPPQALPGAVDRPQLVDTLQRAVSKSRVTVVTAPSGFGKSVAVAQWARATSSPVAWLTLSRFDSDPVRLMSAVVRALQSAVAGADDPEHLELLAIDPASRDVGAGYEAIRRATAALESRIALVVDDAHRAGDAADEGILGALVDQAPDSLRLVLVSRQRLHLPLERLALSGGLSTVDAGDLRFGVDEIVAAASALGRELDHGAAARIEEATGGWPAAVRLTILSETGSVPGRLLADFVDREILAALPTELREFVLAATVLPEATVPVVADVTGAPRAAALLEECVDRGLFLERFGDPDGAPVYRWHSLFRAECRAVLERAAPERRRELDLRAARALAESDPLSAIDHARRAGDSDSAVAIILDTWIGVISGASGASALEQVCRALPADQRERPSVQAIRACCIDTLGDRLEAQRLFAVAADRDAASDPAFPRVRAVAELFLTDEHGRLAAAADRLHDELSRGDEPGWFRAGALWMLGMTEVRLRRPQLATRVLEAAERAAQSIGEGVLARRAASQRAFMLAFAGEFEEAESLLDRIRDTSIAEDGWHASAGGAEDCAAGWIAYWRAEFATAERRFRRVIEAGTAPNSLAGIARMYLAFIAAAVGDRAERAEAAELLRGLPTTATHGVPWPAYRLVSLARLAEADGRPERAWTIARRFERIDNIPAAGVVVAELLRRAGDGRAAMLLLDQLRSTGSAPYIRASAGVTVALVQRGRGNTDAAHELFEQALDIAAPRGIRRPFWDDEPALRAFVVEHAAWGTRHESFLAESAASAVPSSARTLSDREREILGYLRTTMTTMEIADALHVSVNTIKTHVRAVYRKLGVASRREAVRIRD